MKTIEKILATTVVTGTLALQGALGNAQSLTPKETSSTEAVRPFKVHIPKADLNDLRRRILATKFPDKETVADQSQGAQLLKFQNLIHYWGTQYDWRKAEAKLNALPQFMTTIDGVDIHFIHVRSKEANALPIIISHGWPGSIFELLKIIEPLTNPTAYGGKADDAFDVVIPSLPGFGFSGRPTETGWNTERIAHAWIELMKRLGYTQYVAQGGDWGAGVVNAMGRLAPAELLAIHSNLPATVPADLSPVIAAGGPIPAGLSEQEHSVVETLIRYNKTGSATYAIAMGTRPQALGYGFADSPSALAAYFLLHAGFANWNYGEDAQRSPSIDEVLDDISLYWLTNTSTSAARLYWENMGKSPTSAAAQRAGEIKVPVAVTVFPEEVYRAPESWAKRAYPNLVYFNEVDKGGHFAAWEQPELFTKEMRAAFKSFR